MDEVATYLLKFEKSEKPLWKEHAKKHFGGNMARMIRTAVNRMINGELSPMSSSGISQEQIDRSVNSAIAKSSLSKDVDTVQKKLDQLAGFLSAFLVKEDLDNKVKTKGGSKFDF